MKIEVREFNNVYGYPTLTPELHAALKDKYNVVVGVEHLFTDKHKPKADEITVVIDAFAKLRCSRVPILGYVAQPNGVWVKSSFSPRDLIPNKVKIQHPHYLGATTSTPRPPVSMLLAFNKCKTAEEYQALADKYAPEIKAAKIRKFKWLKRAIGAALKGESGEEGDAPTEKEVAPEAKKPKKVKEKAKK